MSYTLEFMDGPLIKLFICLYGVFHLYLFHTDPEKVIGCRWLKMEQIDSTNSQAKLFSSDTDNHGLVITATSQTAGRGQYARRWQAPLNTSVLLSVLIFPSERLRRPVLLTAWAAVSICEVVLELSGFNPRIKWPNDIHVNQRKICGILCEAGSNHVIVGIGFNVRQTPHDFAMLALPGATSLFLESGQQFAIPEVTNKLIEALDRNYKIMESGTSAEIENRWVAFLSLKGKKVIIEKMDGHHFSGRLLEISFGNIVIEHDHGEFTSLSPEAIRQIRSEAE